MGATLTVRIAADINSFSKNLTKVEKDFVRAAKRIETVGKDLSVAVTAPLLALGAAFAKSAADDAASVDRLKRVFGGAASEMEGFIKQVMKTIPATDDALRELTGTTQNFLTQLGIAPKAAVGMTETLTKLAGDMAAFNHVDVGTAFDALEKGLAGKTKGLTSLGVVISEQMIKQEAYRMGLAKVGAELSQSATAHAALSLIVQKMGVQTGASAATAGDASKAWGFFKQSIDSLSDSLGSVLLPVMSRSLQIVTGAANRISEMGTTAKLTTVIFGGLAAAIGPILLGLASITRAIIVLRASALGLGGSLAAGGAVIVGLGLLALLLAKSGEAARNAKKDADDYRSSLMGLTADQLKWQRIQSNLDLSIAQKRLAGTPRTVMNASRAGRTQVGNPAWEEANRQLKLAQNNVAAVQNAVDKLNDSAAPTSWVPPAITAIDKLTFRFNELRDAADRVIKDMMDEKRDWWKSYIDSGAEALSITEKVGNALKDLRPSLLEAATSLLSITIPEVQMPTVNVNDGLTKNQIKAQEKMGIHVTSNADKNAQLLKSTIESTTANLASVLVSALNIGGGGRASQIGGAFGGAIGFGVGTFAGAKMGGLLGSIVPGVGTIVGSLIGSAIGGLFSHHKKSVDHNTEAIKALTQAMQQNAPSGFKIDAYRYAASPGVTQGRRPMTGASTYVTIQGDVHVHDVQDPESFWDAVTGKSSSIRSRGGVSQLAIASGSFR